MRTIQETRLECIRLATVLASSKAIEPGNVIEQAKAYFAWIRGDDPHEDDCGRGPQR